MTLMSSVICSLDRNAQRLPFLLCDVLALGRPLSHGKTFVSIVDALRPKMRVMSSVICSFDRNAQRVPFLLCVYRLKLQQPGSSPTYAPVIEMDPLALPCGSCWPHLCVGACQYCDDMEAWYFRSMMSEQSESEVSWPSTEPDEEDGVMSDEDQDMEAWWEKEAIKSHEEDMRQVTYLVALYEGTELLRERLRLANLPISI